MVDKVMGLFNPRIFTVVLLGFSSGLPLSLTGSTLQAWYAVSNIDIVTIGFLTLVSQPYVYKFLWAPFFDRFVPPFLGRRKGWVFCMQVALIFAIALLGSTDPAKVPMITAYCAFLVALLSASQDISIDAYATDLLKPEERGFGVAMGAGGYRIAMLLSGGVALIIADRFGWHSMYYFMAMCLGLGMFASLFGPSPETVPGTPHTFREAVIEPFKEFVSREKGLLLLLFIVLFKMGDGFTNMASGLTTTFFIRYLGFSLTDVGIVSKGVGLVAVLSGLFVGGLVLARMRLFTALMVFGVLQGVSNLAFIVLAIAGKNFLLMAVVVFVENFCGGLVNAALVSFLMSLCDKRYTATQYALLSALSAVCRVYSGPIAGYVVKYTGWVDFYIFTFFMAIPGLVLLLFLRKEIAYRDVRRDADIEDIATSEEAVQAL